MNSWWILSFQLNFLLATSEESGVSDTHSANQSMYHRMWTRIRILYYVWVLSLAMNSIKIISWGSIPRVLLLWYNNSKPCLLTSMATQKSGKLCIFMIDFIAASSLYRSQDPLKQMIPFSWDSIRRCEILTSIGFRKLIHCQESEEVMSSKF